MNHSCTGRQGGFTLIEALVTIMIIGILLGLAAPSFQSYTAAQRVKTVSFDLYAALVFARSEALKRKQTITVAPASGGDWTTGWTVTGGGSTLRVQDPTTGVAISGSASVVFRQDGRLTAASAAGVLIQPGTADSSIRNRCIRIDLTGLPKSSAIAGTICP